MGNNMGIHTYKLRIMGKNFGNFIKNNRQIFEHNRLSSSDLLQ